MNPKKKLKLFNIIKYDYHTIINIIRMSAIVIAFTGVILIKFIKNYGDTTELTYVLIQKKLLFHLFGIVLVICLLIFFRVLYIYFIYKIGLVVEGRVTKIYHKNIYSNKHDKELLYENRNIKDIGHVIYLNCDYQYRAKQYNKEYCYFIPFTKTREKICSYKNIILIVNLKNPKRSYVQDIFT